MARNVTVWKRRRISFYVTLLDANGDNISISAGDNIRMMIGRGGQTSILNVDYRNPTPNGSQLTLENPTLVTLAAGDLDDDFRPGIYDAEFLHIDDAGESEPIHADLHYVIVHETQEGSVSIDEESSSTSSFSSSSSSSSS